MTKEELIAENSRLMQALDIELDKDRKIRKEFSETFGWKQNQYMNGVTDIKSWERIFVEVGKLLKVEEQENLRDEIKNLKEEIENDKQLLGE